MNRSLEWIGSRTTRVLGLVVVASVLMPLVACATAGESKDAAKPLGKAESSMVTVTGTAIYRERIALAPGAVFEAVLEDVTLADAPAKEIAKTTIASPAGPPFAFTLTAKSSEIDPGRRYSVRARILIDGKLRFTSDTHHAVLTKGAGTTVEILMKGVPGGVAGASESAKPDASLENTYWRLVTLMDTPVTAQESRREPQMMLKSVDGERRYSATVGCNQLVGGYEIEGNAITFAGGATTLMACPPPLDAWERTLAQVLSKAKTWTISGDVLALLDENGVSIARFEAVYL